MRESENGTFDPDTLAVMEAAFEEARIILNFDANDKTQQAELARCILRLAMEGERDAIRLRDAALLLFSRSIKWRQVS